MLLLVSLGAVLCLLTAMVVASRRGELLRGDVEVIEVAPGDFARPGAATRLRDGRHGQR